MNRFTVTILLLMCGLMLKAVAQQTYTPINGMLKEGACLVGSVSGDGQMYYLSAIAEGKSTSKMKGVKLLTNEKNHVVATDDCLWKIEFVDTGKLRLLSLAEKAYLSRKNDEKLDLMLSHNANSLCDWYYEQSPDKSLHLYATTEKNRQLAVDLNTNGTSSFANYSTSYTKERSLIFYHTSALEEGCNVVPQPNENVCLTTNDLQQTCTWNGGVVSCSDAALMNGHVAPFNGLQTWTIEVATEGDSSFCMKSGDEYLAYDMTRATQKYAWKIKNGYICTTEYEPRYLDFCEGKWRMLTDVSTLNQCVRLCKVEDAPTSEITTQRVRVLKGGWTASALADCTYNDMQCLDLTHISLPRNLQEFKHTVDNDNIPIFVNEEESKALQNGVWRFVITCGENTNQLFDNHLLLADKKPFYTDRSFMVGAGQIVYQRTEQPTDRWQTLSLPFKAKAVSGTCYQLKSIMGENLTFAKTDLLDANTGYIVCPNNNGIINVESEACTINNADVTAPFKGTNKLLEVETGDDAMYMLHPMQQCFKRAATGSHLYPFRAYITNQTTASKMNIKLIKW